MGSPQANLAIISKYPLFDSLSNLSRQFDLDKIDVENELKKLTENAAFVRTCVRQGNQEKE